MRASAVELRDVFCVHRSNEGDAAALQGMNLSLGAGELLCVLGPSGAGKSTLLRVIAGLQPPQAGIVEVLGHDMGRLPGRARAELRHGRLGFLGQHSDMALPPDLRARDCVALPLGLRGVSARKRRARVDQLLEVADLAAIGGAFAHELSGGERQRLALCMALAHRPALLLADEPTGELDAAGAQRTRELIAELVRGERASAIVVSHDPATVAIADRTVKIRDGRVVEEDEALVVDRQGWVRLPDQSLSSAGIHGRARVRAEKGRVVLTPADANAEPRPPAARPPAMERSEPALIELRSVTREYQSGGRGRRVIDALTHTFGPGRLTVVAGRSGTGKTTLLRLLAGLDEADAGEIWVDGQRLLAHDPERCAALRRERIGYLPQEPTPVGFLSALENVILVLRVRGWGTDASTARAEAALARVGLAERAVQRVSRLSAGESQRVALARALASAQGLVIVDEPTSRLDQQNTRVVSELLRAAARDGHTVICATHDPVLLRGADEVLELGGSQAHHEPPAVETL